MAKTIGSDAWNKYEIELKKKGAMIIYLPYTQTTSSTILQQTIKIFNKSVCLFDNKQKTKTIDAVERVILLFVQRMNKMGMVA